MRASAYAPILDELRCAGAKNVTLLQRTHTRACNGSDREVPASMCSLVRLRTGAASPMPAPMSGVSCVRTACSRTRRRNHPDNRRLWNGYGSGSKSWKPS